MSEAQWWYSMGAINAVHKVHPAARRVAILGGNPRIAVPGFRSLDQHLSTFIWLAPNVNFCPLPLLMNILYSYHIEMVSTFLNKYVKLLNNPGLGWTYIIIWYMTETYWDTWKHIETRWNILKHFEAHWNTLKHIETTHWISNMRIGTILINSPPEDSSKLGVRSLEKNGPIHDGPPMLSRQMDYHLENWPI